jgi:putative toxin-antitoxin system antitoxin component (TIGR02293 family)
MGVHMLQLAPVRTIELPDHREPVNVYCRIELKLGATSLRSELDLARIVEERLPLSSIEAFSENGLTEDEIYRFILPRRTLSHRKSRGEFLTHEESDRAVRLARVISLAEEVFGEDARAGRWLRKPKVRFSGRTPLELLRTDAGARLVEEMLLQLDYGFAA